MAVITGSIKKSELDNFKEFLDGLSYIYREGKGEYQALQVEINGNFEILYSKKDYPDRFIAYSGMLGGIIETFNKNKGNESNQKAESKFVDELIQVLAIAGVVNITESDKNRLTKLFNEAINR